MTTRRRAGGKPDPRELIKVGVRLPRAAHAAVKEEAARTFGSAQEIFLEMICQRYPEVRRQVEAAPKRVG